MRDGMPRWSVLLAALCAGTVPAAEPAPAPSRQAELLHLLRHDCGSCHGLTLRGGLGPPLLPQTLARKDLATLHATVLYGVPGTAMPPWTELLSAREIEWLVGQLKHGIAP